jgi:hypothetical protein
MTEWLRQANPWLLLVVGFILGLNVGLQYALWHGKRLLRGMMAGLREPPARVTALEPLAPRVDMRGVVMANIVRDEKGVWRFADGEPKEPTGGRR